MCPTPSKQSSFWSRWHVETGMNLIRSLKRLAQDKRGVTTLEYGLLAAVLGVAMMAGAGQFSANSKNIFKHVSTFIQ